VAHDVFVRAYQGLAGFSGKSAFSQWLAGIAIRTSYDFWRGEYRRREIPISQLEDTHRDYIENTLSDVSEETFDRDERRSEAAEILEWALNRLSAPERIVLELVYLEEYSHKEAAELLGWSVVNVKVRAHRARKKLTRILLEKQTQREVSP
jgi:RNA polymerase sigma-70 factor (ECF subfamily)